MTNTQTIVFLGDVTGFGYARVGGAESCIRRLSRALVTAGHRVNYLLFGDRENRVCEMEPGLTVRRFIHLRDALAALKENQWDHVVEVLVRPAQQVAWAGCRRRLQKRMTFHKMFFGGYGRGIGARCHRLLDRAVPHNGKYFVFNEDTHETIETTQGKAVLLPPPIPDAYYLQPHEKTDHGKINIAFVGRLDPEKGIHEVISLFERLAQDPQVRTTIYGYTWKHLPVSQQVERYLLNQKTINYVSRPHTASEAPSDTHLRAVLRHTDIMVLPYQAFRRTLDPPLLLLEAMASLCLTITRPVGSVARFVSDPEYLIADSDFVDSAARRIEVVRQSIQPRREKLCVWNTEHGCYASRTADLFLRHLTGDE